jgi:hypothetical protein
VEKSVQNRFLGSARNDVEGVRKMTEPNSQKEKPKDKRRYDPELLKKGLRCDLDQLEMLKRCSEKMDMTEWKEWRKEHPYEDILLEGANLRGKYLKYANLQNALLKEASIEFANLEKANLLFAHLESSKLQESHLEGADLSFCNLQGTDCIWAIVDGSTFIWMCRINRHTDFRGVGLNNARIDPGTKQLLEYNIRRMNWEENNPMPPIKGTKREENGQRNFSLMRFNPRRMEWELCKMYSSSLNPLKWTARVFWWISDYGISTKRIIFTFFGLAFLFALLYRLFPGFVMVYGKVGDIRGFWHALYFSVVTMTTLGFGDIASNPDSWVGQTLLMIQVILGYVLLGALVTRFAVLFTAGGPAGKFADEKEKEDEKKRKKNG